MWFDFSDLATVHFDMASHVAARFFVFVPGPTIAGAPSAPSYTELVFAHYAFVPRAPKDYYQQLPADKRERDFCLVWMAEADIQRLTTVKLADGTNAGRILDVQRSKWYAVTKEWDYGRQGALNGVIGELIDGPVPAGLPGA